jgi:predicted PurR-regulated permease PerM
VPAKKLVVSTYFQYVLIGAVALLLFAFERQLGGVLLTFLLAGVLAYMLNPLVRWLEGRSIPRVLAVLGVFAGPVVVVLVALFVLVGAVFAVPIVAIIAAVFRYLRGTVLFERWHKAPVFAPNAGETAERPTPEEDPPGEVQAVTDVGKSSPGTGGKGL